MSTYLHVKVSKPNSERMLQEDYERSYGSNPVYVKFRDGTPDDLFTFCREYKQKELTDTQDLFQSHELSLAFPALLFRKDLSFDTLETLLYLLVTRCGSYERNFYLLLFRVNLTSSRVNHLLKLKLKARLFPLDLTRLVFLLKSENENLLTEYKDFREAFPVLVTACELEEVEFNLSYVVKEVPDKFLLDLLGLIGLRGKKFLTKESYQASLEVWSLPLVHLHFEENKASTEQTNPVSYLSWERDESKFPKAVEVAQYLFEGRKIPVKLSEVHEVKWWKSGKLHSLLLKASKPFRKAVRIQKNEKEKKRKEVVDHYFRFFEHPEATKYKRKASRKYGICANYVLGERGKAFDGKDLPTCTNDSCHFYHGPYEETHRMSKCEGVTGEFKCPRLDICGDAHDAKVYPSEVQEAAKVLDAFVRGNRLYLTEEKKYADLLTSCPLRSLRPDLEGASGGYPRFTVDGEFLRHPCDSFCVLKQAWCAACCSEYELRFMVKTDYWPRYYCSFEHYQKEEARYVNFKLKKELEKLLPEALVGEVLATGVECRLPGYQLQECPLSSDWMGNDDRQKKAEEFMTKRELSSYGAFMRQKFGYSYNADHDGDEDNY